MALVSLAGVVLYLIGIPSLFFYKLFSNRAYTIFTKSLSMLSEQVETGEERPEKAVQRMLELADMIGYDAETVHALKQRRDLNMKGRGRLYLYVL